MKPRALTIAACLLALLSTVGAALPYPILPPLFAGSALNDFNHFLGLPPKLLFGIAVTINPIGLLIGSAVLGPLADRYGHRPVLLATAFGGAAGHALSAVGLALQSYPLFLAARLFTGLMEGNGSVARALLADQLAGDERFRAMSLLNGAFFLGWLAGPLLGGATVHWGVTTPFWIAVAALAFTAILVARALPRTPPATAAARREAAPSWWQVARRQHALNLLRHADLRTLFLVELAYASGVTAFYEFYPLWLVEVAHFDARGIALTTAAMCALMTGCSVLAGRFAGGDPLRRACWSALGVAACVLGVALGGPVTGLLAIILYGLPNAVWSAVIPSWSAERFGRAHGQGAVMGLISTTFCLASILTAAAGSLLTLIDTRLILALGATLTAGAAVHLRAWRRSEIMTSSASPAPADPSGPADRRDAAAVPRSPAGEPAPETPSTHPAPASRP
ncbi:MFS transporter [Massilia arenosa]|uniref:MFS transporter n=1 Tax=Zemynaea arenosa TaxID=2561931 RepID=A0A4Y9SDM9_9BURK|nr:MFS transporter [Massilia arenosa]TFW20849.1 MFS transporter [Massilia arenosa]